MVASPLSFYLLTLKMHYKKNEQLRRAYCGGCENCRYMSPIAAHFWPAAIHEIYCGVFVTAAIGRVFCGVL